MQAGHLKVARLQQEKALAALRQLDPLALSPGQALRLLVAGLELERHCLTEPAVAELQRQVDELTAMLEGRRQVTSVR